MRSRQHLLAGICLIGCGTLFLIDQLGVPVLSHLWKAWPLVLIAAGLWKLAQRRLGRPSQLSGAARLLVLLSLIPGLALTTMRGELDRSAASPAGQAGRTIRPPRPPEHPEPPRLPERLVDSADSELPVSGELALALDGVDVEVEPGALPGRVVRAELFDAESALQGTLAIELRRDDERLSVSVTGLVPGPRQSRPRLHVSAPPGTSFEGRVSGGDLAVTAMRVSRVVARASRVQIAGSSGELDVEATFGSVHLAGGNGEARVRASHADLEIAGMQGNLELEASGTRITLVALQGRLQARLDGSEMELSALVGDADVAIRGGRLRAQQVTGGVDVKGSDSTLEIRRVSGPVAIAGSMRRVRVDDVSGGLNARVDDAGVDIGRVDGGVEITARRGNVRLERVGGPLRARVEDGDLWAALSPAQSLEAECLRGDVTLALGDADPQLELRAEGGRIDRGSERGLEVKVSGATSTATGSAGANGAPVTVTAQLGSIRLLE